MWTKLKENLKAHKPIYFSILGAAFFVVCLYCATYLFPAKVVQLQSPPSSIYPQYIKCTMIYEPSTNPTWSITSSITVEVKNEKDMQSFRRQAYNNQFIHILRPPPVRNPR